MNHLAKKKKPLAGVFANSFVGALNRILYAITKSKVPRENERDIAKRKFGWRKVLLARIVVSPAVLDFPNYGRPEVLRNVEFFHFSSVFVINDSTYDSILSRLYALYIGLSSFAFLSPSVEPI
jgi:hypothetical protein